jgi:hypothetical protein
VSCITDDACITARTQVDGLHEIAEPVPARTCVLFKVYLLAVHVCNIDSHQRTAVSRLYVFAVVREISSLALDNAVDSMSVLLVVASVVTFIYGCHIVLCSPQYMAVHNNEWHRL